MIENAAKGGFKLQAEPAQDWLPEIIAEFIPAPEQVSPGMPGKNAGDHIIAQHAAGSHTALISLGPANKITLEAVRRAGGVFGKWLKKSGSVELGIEVGSLRASLPSHSIQDLAEAVLVGLFQGAYSFDEYKHADEPTQGVTVGLILDGKPWLDRTLIARVQAITSALELARSLAHQPANVINPITLAERAREVAGRSGLKITVLDDRQLAEMGAGAILAVGRGSQTPARMIILEYAGQEPSRDEKPVVLVGKAITFDTGGYSIKNTEGIVGMKYDKCGGVDVLAALQLVSALKIKTPVVGIISAAENMISGESYRPDDIITSLSGKTIEIISTDAEGRLVLADGLAYAQKNYQPRAIVDLATLTGGVVTALGRVRAGLMSNNDELADQLFEAGEVTGERLWRLPLDEEYSRNMKGEDADLKNSGGREGHAILGGAFLKAFVSDDVPWAHLDIAGVADVNKDLPHISKGATGFGVRLLLEYLENLS